MGRRRIPIRERLDNYKILNEETGCHEWSKGLDRCGYGLVKYNDKMRLVHRVAYEVYHGVNPEGYEVLHSCDNPKCYNPAHLSLGSHSDNMRDCVSKGRHFTPFRKFQLRG